MTFVQAARLLCASRSNVPPQFREKRHKIGEHDVAEHIKEIALLLREERAFRLRVSVCVCVCWIQALVPFLNRIYGWIMSVARAWE